MRHALRFPHFTNPPMLTPQANTLRHIHVLDGFWQFRRDPQNTGEAEGWQNGFAGECELAVPGNWNEQQVALENYFGLGWYARKFTLTAEEHPRGATVHLGAVHNRAVVWLNGHQVGSHVGASLPFECDLAEHLKFGEENLLVVRVDASINPWDLPPARIEANATHEGFHNSNPAVTYDFFPYGGIPRSVVLQLTPQRTALATVRVNPQLSADRSSADVEIITTLTSASPDDASDISRSLEVRIEDQVQTVDVDATGQSRVRIAIPAARLWDLGQPELYEAKVTLLEDGVPRDTYTRTFGLRTIEVTDDELLLNGKSVFLRGFGKHEDFPVLGRGLSLPLVVRDFDLLRWIGANSFRTSHYPYAEEWYDYADRHGILIIGETPMVGLCERLFTSAETLERAKGIVTEMIDRDHHHPSVIMWSVANEPWIESPAGEHFIRELLRVARERDDSRPITYVAHNGAHTNAPCADCDVVAFNRYGGWYDSPGDIEAGNRLLEQELNSYRNAFGKPLLLAEFGADAIPGEHSVPATMFTEEFQADIIGAQMTLAESHPAVIGTHVWAFSDFKTAQSITRAARNQKGVFTRERAPKMAAHRIRQLWQQPKD